MNPKFNFFALFCLAHTLRKSNLCPLPELLNAFQIPSSVVLLTSNELIQFLNQNDFVYFCNTVHEAGLVVSWVFFPVHGLPGMHHNTWLLVLLFLIYLCIININPVLDLVGLYFLPFLRLSLHPLIVSSAGQRLFISCNPFVSSCYCFLSHKSFQTILTDSLCIYQKGFPLADFRVLCYI